MSIHRLFSAPHLFRECCWQVEKRGSVGETTFHVCFLMQTPTHLALGRRLLKWYPKLINDVYLSEEYYGAFVLYTDRHICNLIADSGYVLAVFHTHPYIINIYSYTKLCMHLTIY